MREAASRHVQVRAVVRNASAQVPSGVESSVVADIGPNTSWSSALDGVDAVVHLAAKVHDMKARGEASLEAYRAVNTAGTANLARQAAKAGVSRFVFLSSVKVNGEEGRFTESDRAAPADPYAVSKHEAELELRRIANTTNMAAVIVRAPLVYGPGVGANFRMLMRSVASGVPLPLGAIDNKRSFVGLDNLVDFILTCVDHTSAPNETFFVSDGEDLSTPELVRRVARALERPSRLLPVPRPFLMGAAALVGKRASMQRLLGTLQVDISKARDRLGWSPPVTVDEGLRRAAIARR
jgi:nucleoside-diphosphate-sugar epimerase